MSRLMLYKPRTIALICELLHPQMQPDPNPIQRIHNDLFQTGDPPYSSFSVTPAGAVLSNPVHVAGASSFVAFLADRFEFREELSSLTHEDFAARVRSIARQVSALRGLQVFTGQRVTLRTLVNPRAFRDSRQYLKEGLFGFDEETQVFGREPQLFGLRMVFPSTNDHPGHHHLRIESFSNDQRSLFIEDAAAFGPIVVDSDLAAIEENIHASYRFVTEQTMRFIAGFDTRPGPDGA